MDLFLPSTNVYDLFQILYRNRSPLCTSLCKVQLNANGCMRCDGNEVMDRAFVSLTTLELFNNLNEVFIAGNESMYGLADLIASFPRLHTLRLKGVLDVNRFFALCDIAESIKYLQQLDLSGFFVDSDVAVVLSGVLAEHWTALTSLTLQLLQVPYENHSDQIFDIICSSLPALQRLEFLTISYQVDDCKFTTLMESLPVLTALQRLNISGVDSLTSNMVNNFCSALAPLKSIQMLKVNCSVLEASDVISLIEFASEQLKELIELYIIPADERVETEKVIKFVRTITRFNIFLRTD